MQADELI